MKTKERMISFLSALLEDGETLSCPFYGTLDQGDKQFAGYFGLTENVLLIALLSLTGTKTIYTMRVPLDIRSFRARRTALLRQSVFNITFQKGAPCRILVPPIVAGLSTQRDALSQFSALLQARTPQAMQPLTTRDGERIRRQSLNDFIVYILPFLPIPMVLGCILTYKKDGFLPLATVTEYLAITTVIGVILLLPRLFLPLWNRFGFDRLVCVLGKDALYTEDGALPWSEIRSISHTHVSFGKNDTHASFTTVSVGKNGEDYQIVMRDLPFFCLRRIKKHCPAATVTVCDKGWILFWAVFPTAISLLIALFL